MSLHINPHTLDTHYMQIMGAVSALDKINKIIREHINKSDDPENDGMDGVDYLIDCIRFPLLETGSYIERMKYWAEETDTDINFRQYYGNETVIIDQTHPERGTHRLTSNGVTRIDNQQEAG